MIHLNEKGYETFRLATCMHIDLEDTIKRKAEYNATRPPGHGRVA